MSNVTVLCCGSRDYDNIAAISMKLLDIQDEFDEVTVVHGGADGADTFCGEVAQLLEMTVKVFDAEWDKVGSKRAGLYRNTQMLWEARPDIVLAFRKRRNSKGTNDMIRKATMKGIKVEIIDDF